MSSSSARSPGIGGTPTPPGVEFVRYTRSCGLGFRQTGPQTPRMAVRAVFRASGRARGLDGCHPRPRTHPGQIARARHGQAPGWRPIEDHVGRVVGHDGARGLEYLAARRSRGGPETRGQRGRGPPPASAGDSRSVAPRSTLLVCITGVRKPAAGRRRRGGSASPEPRPTTRQHARRHIEQIRPPESGGYSPQSGWTRSRSLPTVS